MERARQAMVVLEDRVNATQTELEKREVYIDSVFVRTAHVTSMYMYMFVTIRLCVVAPGF